MSNDTKSREVRLSQSTKDAIQDILTRLANLDSDSAEQLVYRIELMCGAWTPDDEVGQPSSIKKEIAALHESIDKLKSALGGLSIHALSTLSGCLDDQSADRDVLEYDSGDPRGSTLADIRHQAEIVGKVAAMALSGIEVSRGARPKVAARLTAYFVAECLWDSGLDVTTYEDGLYFQILRYIFEETMPDIGEEAYRRHGNWAIKNEGNIGIQFTNVRMPAK